MSRNKENPQFYPVWFRSYEVVRVAPKAIAVVPAGRSSQHVPIWIPKSQIEKKSELNGASKVGDVGDIAIPQWLADKIPEL